jgi:hypothetical protein
MLEAAARVGVTIDLAAGRWRAVDGRAGTTEPFAVDDEDDSLGLPPPKATLAPVSLASVMREQASGKEGTSTTPSTGILNPRGEYNCFLNVIVQALWHVEAFRKALMGASSADPLVRALQGVMSELTASHDASEGDSRAPVSAESLRIALSDEHGVLFKLGDMADAAEAHARRTGGLYGLAEAQRRRGGRTSDPHRNRRSARGR